MKSKLLVLLLVVIAIVTLGDWGKRPPSRVGLDSPIVPPTPQRTRPPRPTPWPMPVPRP